MQLPNRGPLFVCPAFSAHLLSESVSWLQSSGCADYVSRQLLETLTTCGIARVIWALKNGPLVYVVSIERPDMKPNGRSPYERDELGRNGTNQLPKIKHYDQFVFCEKT